MSAASDCRGYASQPSEKTMTLMRTVAAMRQFIAVRRSGTATSGAFTSIASDL
jgi:hypothetical protein